MHVSTYLMFTGDAEAALNFYRQVFPDMEVSEVNRYPEESGELAGKLLPTRIVIGDHNIMLTDSPNVHQFSFTPSMSIFINFETEEELVAVHDRLCAEGEPLMPLDDYDFSRMFAWIQDKFGVSWQLNLP
ncbi:VOC family protein [Ponticaulis sp.]|jgi:predicted 3-demethylubiquinone-9 3-methyltransferase (glyoxalase superfamily)|uniref:VOC family protein n=1 Tax=Ponticaulis sp. TaxID=2020902 RepID=UPI00261589C4|nr:VOC family protein [Ponticaulis sp.]MDF1679958.1 VOC family protein [Ponticaulis sp.]